MSTDAEKIAAIKELCSTTCACGASKRVNQSLCRACFGSLRRDLQRALNTRIGGGYVGAYKLALAELKEKGNIAA